MKSDKVFLLDAYALIFRAYYAFLTNPIKNSKGFNTSTIFGFINTLDEVLRKEKPDHIAVVFDPPPPNFRHKLYEKYKANREETPENIIKSVPWIKQIIEAFNIPVIECSGFEADDVIGTLAKQAEKQGYTVYMMTPDKDYAQLVSENIFVYKPKRSGNQVEIWDVDFVKEKFHVENPVQVIDVLSLWGDASDNVPGVPGIGEKTSKKIISNYGSLESALDNIDDFKGKQKENLINFKEQAFLSKTLVTIRLDVPVNFDSESFKYNSFNKEKLTELFDELEFKTLKARILENNKKSPLRDSSQPELFTDLASDKAETVTAYSSIKTVQKNYIELNNINIWESLLNEIIAEKAFCFDTETTSLDPLKAELIGIAISLKADKGYYFDYKTHKNNDIFFLLKGLIENPEYLKVGQNLKYDIRILKNVGIHCQGPLFDTMVAHYLLYPEQRHNLNVLSEQFLNYSPIKIESLIGEKGKSQKTMDQVNIREIIDYACEDADLTWQLYLLFSKELEEKNLRKLASDLEMPLIYVLSEMENSGVKLESTILKHYASELREELIQKENLVYDKAGTRFNISSPRQLGEILFEKLKIAEGTRKTKTKQFSTSEDVLTSLIDKHDIIPLILEFRSLKKLLSTYVEALPKLIQPSTGRLHTSYNQALVATGRLSSNNPNLQNIPIREVRGREIRKSFVPGSPENVLIAADYSQIELRIMAHLSKDPNMIDAFNKNMDIHTATASKIFKVGEEDVSREMRSQAKTANFGIIYGISAYGLSQRLKIKRTEAKALIEGYFESYPEVKKYMDQSVFRAREDGYVRTIMGRYRYLPDIRSGNSVVRGIAERNAINSPIQGSAADIIKIAMLNIHERMQKEDLSSLMILQVHDELIFDVVPHEQLIMKELIKEEMENAFELRVPLTVDIGVGNNWLEAH